MQTPRYWQYMNQNDSDIMDDLIDESMLSLMQEEETPSKESQ